MMGCGRHTGYHGIQVTKGRDQSNPVAKRPRVHGQPIDSEAGRARTGALSFSCFLAGSLGERGQEGCNKAWGCNNKNIPGCSQILKGETQKGKREKRRRPACPAKSAHTCTHSSVGTAHQQRDGPP